MGKVHPGNAGYYQQAVVAGVEDYYAGDGEAPGVWIGRADLMGAVAGSLATAVDSKLLLEAKCAPDGTRLGRTAVGERSVTAFDLTFSAPKSVSVLYALGAPDVVAAVEAAHTAAVEQAISSVSSRIAYTRTGHAGAAVVDADGVFGIRYRHRTSRALDPQLHDHVLISNAVRAKSDGEWRTLDARGLYRNAKAAGVEYQTYLRAGLRTSLGVEFGEVDENGQADAVGIDDAVLAEFSTRSVDVEAALADWTTGFVERDGRPPSPAEVGKAHKTIVLATRPGKPDESGHPTSTLRHVWRTRANQLVDVDRVLADTAGNVPAPGMIVRPDVDVVLAAVETRHAEWAESQLIEQIAMRADGPDPKAIAAVIEDARREAMASAKVVDLCPPPDAHDLVRASDGRSVELPPSAVRYTTSAHLRREVDVLEWATSPVMLRHRALSVDSETADGLDPSQAAAVASIVGSRRPVVTVVGPAGAGKTRMLAAAVDTWREAGVSVFGVGPSASSAKHLADGAGTPADTLHKLVYENSTKWTRHRKGPDPDWFVPMGSVVIIDEAGMVDTRLLHTYAQIAQRNKWRTVLVGDHHQLDAVDAGGMFAELVNDLDVLTAELDTLHRFDQEWEAEASLRLREGDSAAVGAYDEHGRIHGHANGHAAIAAVSDAAVAGITDGRDVLVMASANRVVDEVNETVTDRLVVAGSLRSEEAIEIGGRRFYPGQPVVTRANDRRLTYGMESADWVRNGDRWIVIAGTRDELYLAHREIAGRVALPAGYVEAGNVRVDYASTIHRAQGATVDEAHLIVAEHTDAKQLYVGATRGRLANHIHTSPPSVDADAHGLRTSEQGWSAALAVTRTIGRAGYGMSALGSRRHLRGQVDADRQRNQTRRRREGLSR